MGHLASIWRYVGSCSQKVLMETSISLLADVVGYSGQLSQFSSWIESADSSWLSYCRQQYTYSTGGLGMDQFGFKAGWPF
jgi:hypothetical protein